MDLTDITLLAPHNLPFAGAAILLLLIVILQVIGAGDFFDSGDVDIDLDVDGAADGLEPSGFLESAFSLLGIGRVPFLIWFMVLLLVFMGIGVAGQELAISLLGAPLHPALAAVLAGIGALPVNGVLTRPLERILPKDETSAVGLDSLVRRDAEIQTGTARTASPARAKVKDRHGHPHFVMVEPHDPQAELNEGDTVLLVRREGETFFGVHYESKLLGLD